MFKKLYFLKWDSPPQTAFTTVQLTSQHPLERAQVVASVTMEMHAQKSLTFMFTVIFPQ
jgi:hypothetical protein